MTPAEKRKEYMKAYRSKPENIERSKRLVELNREKINKRERERRSNNREFYNNYNKALRSDSTKKEKYNARAREYKKEKKYKVNESNMRRYQTRKISAIAFDTFRGEIQQIYKKCIEIQEVTGIKHNVDHIIPLINDNVCGLHVPWNLQILTSTENISKNNTFDGTQENESWRKDAIT